MKREMTLGKLRSLQDNPKMNSGELVCAHVGWVFANLGYCSVVGPCENGNEISIQYVSQEFHD
jgi:hypothetical protein